MNIRISQDRLSGLFFCAVAIAGIVLSSRLDLGTPSRMAAGFFPMWLSVVLLGLGSVVLFRSFIREDEPVGQVEVRPLIAVLLGVVVFSVLVERWGFALAGVLLIGVSRFAAGRYKPVEVAILAAALVGFSALIFLYALKLPLRFLPV
ncbi:MAG: tripartite tricarboxylate transporter TctB family protein [Xanthobacteraceae bacterium]|nr:tripartite tricarboxylate transporter TctB family protein [Xanthobacteraceae bacterium]